MTIELKSAQFLSTEYVDTAADQVEGTNAIPVHAVANAQVMPVARKTGSTLLTIFAAIMIVFGIFGVFGAGINLLSQSISLSAADAASSSIQHASIAERQIFERTLEAQKQYAAVTYFNIVLQGLLGIAFVLAGTFLLTRRVNAHTFASMTCVAAIFYNISTVIGVWLIMPSFEGLQGVPEEAGAIASTAMGIGIGLVAMFALFKILFYGFVISYLGRSNVKELFEPASI